MEFLEDLIDKDPNEAFPRASDGDVVFMTNDPLINKWEKLLHSGDDPDLLEGFSKEERVAIERRLARKRKAVVPEEFHDDYTEANVDATE